MFVSLRQAKAKPDCTCAICAATCQAVYEVDSTKSCVKCTGGSKCHKAHADTCAKSAKAGKTHAQVHAEAQAQVQAHAKAHPHATVKVFINRIYSQLPLSNL